MVVTNPAKVVVEAAELTVSRNEIIGPNKLRMIADEGWSISSAWSQSGDGFVMLLQRQIGDAHKKLELVIHKGEMNCPDYCSCEVEYD